MGQNEVTAMAVSALSHAHPKLAQCAELTRASVSSAVLINPISTDLVSQIARVVTPETKVGLAKNAISAVKRAMAHQPNAPAARPPHLIELS